MTRDQLRDAILATGALDSVSLVPSADGKAFTLRLVSWPWKPAKGKHITKTEFEFLAQCHQVGEDVFPVPKNGDYSDIAKLLGVAKESA